MIRDRSSYEFVRIDPTIAINGGIMPLRANQGQLRGEDVAFCLEGVCERISVNHGMQPYPAPSVDGQILGSRWRTCCEELHSLGWATVAPDYEFEGVVYPHSFTPQRLGDLFPGSGLDVSLLKSDASNFERGSPLRKQPILDVFDDLALIRKLWQTGEPSRTSNNYTSSSDGNEPTFRPQATATGRVLLDKYLWRDARYSPEHYWISEARAVSGNIVFQLPSLKFRSRVWGVFNFERLRENQIGGHTEEDRTRFAIVKEMTSVGGGAVGISIGDLVSSAMSFADAHIGHTPTIEDVVLGTGGQRYGEIHFVIGYYSTHFVITELGDHTDWKSAL